MGSPPSPFGVKATVAEFVTAGHSGDRRRVRHGDRDEVVGRVRRGAGADAVRGDDRAVVGVAVRERAHHDGRGDVGVRLRRPTVTRGARHRVAGDRVAAVGVRAEVDRHRVVLERDAVDRRARRARSARSRRRASRSRQIPSVKATSAATDRRTGRRGLDAPARSALLPLLVLLSLAEWLTWFDMGPDRPDLPSGEGVRGSSRLLGAGADCRGKGDP